MAADKGCDINSLNIQNVNIDNYRQLVQLYLNLHIYQAALFWADKVVALTNGNPKDVYCLAQCMYMLKEYHRAAHLLRSRNLEKKFVLCNYLTVKCLMEAHDLNEALKVLNMLDVDVLLQNTSVAASLESSLFDNTPKHKIQSSVLLLKGQILEAMDNRSLAVECYKQALHCDVYSYEAFNALIKHHMLTASEEEKLLNSLDGAISEQCDPLEKQVLLTLYKSKLKKYHTPSPKIIRDISLSCGTTKMDSKSLLSKNENPDTSISENGTGKDVKVNKWLLQVQESIDMAVSEAERLYYNCEYQNCSKLSEKILKQDPYHNECLPIYISCQVELKHSNKLFTLAHTLVDLYPSLAIAWFAVGCYYYTIGKSDLARRFLSKATTLDRLYGPAWLAFGHSFATENEHDQAMAAYFKASQLMKGCHLPLLYIGLECGITNNNRLAEEFFQQAQAIAPYDPFVMHEMGVIAFHNNEYTKAEQYFKNALCKTQSVNGSILPAQWEPLLNNLGHTYRKLRRYEEALEYHHKALTLSPLSASTFSAIAYVNALMGKTEDAVHWFHKALGLRMDDTFSTTMLSYLIEHLSEEQAPYPGAPNFIPNFSATVAKEAGSENCIMIEEEMVAVPEISEQEQLTDMSLEIDMSSNNQT
ncbi:cell division cycle protein 16 homolog [Agrilus planipennis]|uniref:Cell division cycle protein 16 homolog n=1 Tax=Agrilus planipennis TaxID=224129 RepID=A0A1W4XE84_AGRPL|nr:cell division cycle protein 16 homolog [Agrilus planipennis]